MGFALSTLFSGVKEINKTGAAILAGELELNQETAKKLTQKLPGSRYSKQEEAALKALDTAIVAELKNPNSKVKADDIGLHVLRSRFEENTQNRVSKGFQEGQQWSNYASTAATVIAGGGAAVAGAMAGATLAVAVPQVAITAGAAFILAKIGGAIFGFIKGLVQN